MIYWMVGEKILSKGLKKSGRKRKREGRKGKGQEKGEEGRIKKKKGKEKSGKGKRKSGIGKGKGVRGINVILERGGGGQKSGSYNYYTPMMSDS